MPVIEPVELATAPEASANLAPRDRDCLNQEDDVESQRKNTMETLQPLEVNEATGEAKVLFDGIRNVPTGAEHAGNTWTFAKSPWLLSQSH